MGYDQLEVHREALKRHSKGFGDGAKELGRIFAKLDSALAAEGSCWGNDDTGKAFEGKYKAPKETATKAFPALEKSLTKIEAGVRHMAKNYDQAEHASGG
jgi:uncharacterized protein YukE